MIKTKGLEEKKRILAYFLTRQNKTESIEAVFRQYCAWWKHDFTTEGGLLKMYNHSFVLSKTKARQGIEAPEYCKEYYEFLTEVFEYVRNSYDKTISRQENIDKAKLELFDYRNKRDNQIKQIILRNNLNDKGYKYQNQTSRKHPLLLSKCIVIHNFNKYGQPQKTVRIDCYDGVISYLNKITGGR